MKARLVGLLAVLQIAALGLVTPLGAATDDKPVAENRACPDPATSAQWADGQFSDVRITDVHAADIGCIAHHGITIGVGDGTYFAPSQAVPRWQMALFMSRAVQKAGIQLPDQPSAFSDLGKLSAAEVQGVMAAVALGVMPGIEPSSFFPDAPVNRADMALFLTRMLDLTTTPDSPIHVRIDPSGQVGLTYQEGATVDASHPFTDVEGRVEERHEQAISALYLLGVTRGTSETAFSPDRLVTRAQMASFIVRALGHTGVRPSQVTQTPERPGTPAELSETAKRLAMAFQAVADNRRAPANTCLVAYLNGQVIFEELADRPLLPASLVKVVTAAVFLDLAGPDYRFATEVFIESAALAGVENGVLEGDLYLRGGGDPVLSTPRYVSRFSSPRAYTDITQLADTVASGLTDLGIRIIDGAVVADESLYPEQERHYVDMRLTEEGEPIWKQSYVSGNQSGPLSALLLNDGYTRYGASRSSNTRAADPALHTARVFDDLLEARGFVIRNRSGKEVTPPQDQRTSLGVIHSPPARHIVTRMLRFSDNTTAEMIYKEIGRLTGQGSGWLQATRASNQALLQLLGLPKDTTAGVQVADGSGLSYSNRLTCRTVAELLWQAGPGSPLAEGLAVAGESGTLRNCPPGTAPSGASPPDGRQVRGKTGSLNDSSALAGMTVAPNGDVITFALISNQPLISLRLGFCNVLRRAVMAAAIGHPYR